MKKLVFLFALVFAVSMAMAQTSVISQTNTNNSNSGNNVANVTQTGLNTTTITQIQDINGSPGGSSIVTATVEQLGGKNNIVTVKQTHNGTKDNGVHELTTYAKQWGGNSNEIYQTQTAGTGNWGNVIFSAIQNGYRNIATQISYEDAGNDNGDIKQKGNDNKATQKYWGRNYREGGVNGDLFITQIGSENEATQLFKNGTVFYTGTGNRGVAQVTQNGNWNKSLQIQEGAGNKQYLIQNSNYNEARMEAYGNFNLANAKQYGNVDLTIIQKQDEKGEAGDGEFAKGNSVMITQTGANSEAIIMQDGWTNSVEGLGGAGTYAINNNGAYLKVSQKGINNTVQSRQIVSASETVTQMGINNLAIVNQY